MKKILFMILPFMVSSLFSAVQLKRDYTQPKDVSLEMRNIYLNMQGKSFAIFNTTPTLGQLQNGQIVIVSSTNHGIAWRDNNTVFFMTSSGALSSVTYNNSYFSSNTYVNNVTENINNVYTATAGVTNIVAGTAMDVTPIGGTGNVTINFNMPISTAAANNGDCLKYDSSSGLFKPAACGGAAATDYWQLTSNDLSPISGSATDTLWNLSGNDLTPSGGSTADTYWKNDANGDLTPS